MPLPNSKREKILLQEINDQNIEASPQPSAEFLQEIKEPFDENALTETKKKKTKRNSRSR